MNDAGRERRVRAGLEAACEGLEEAGRQAEAGGWRWCAIALTMALQGALVAALSGYETAVPEDVAHPSEEGRVAPLQTLLRRAASPDYLADPERLSGRNSEVRSAMALRELRNRAMHVALSGSPNDFADVADLAPGPLALIRHLVLDAPAFDAASNHMLVNRARAGLQRLETAIC